MPQQIRPAALAGKWYEADPAKLSKSISSYLENAPASPTSVKNIRAIVVPHAGHYWSGPTAAAAYKALDPAAYDRVFILCPNHRVPVRGPVSVSADAFETPLGILPIDTARIEQWRASGIIGIDDGAHRLEHAIEIQLPFVQAVFGTRAPKLIPIIVGELSTDNVRTFADALKSELGPRDLLIISSDFIHYGEDYGFVPFGAPVQPQIRAYDLRTVSAISALDSDAFERFAHDNPHAACGINSLRVLSALYEHTGQRVTELAYDTSGRRSGDDDASVSYIALSVSDAVADDTKSPVSDQAKPAAHALVQRALQSAVSAQAVTRMPKDIDLGPDPDVFRESYGVFVTLNTPDGELRGCIGNIIPVARLAESLWGRAQDAALNDPRFDPVTKDELPGLKVEISVLTKPQDIASYEEIELGRHGIILRKHRRSAVFLPQVAPEQGWTLPQTLSALSMKAGLPPDAWRDGASFQVFEAQVF